MKGVLVDTSVWRRYLAGRTTKRETLTMQALLDEDGGVVVHETVIGELVLGGLAQREEELLRRLPRTPELSSGDILSFIKIRRLPRRGIGWVDAHLLASSLVESVLLWSFDGSLANVAGELDIAFVPAAP